MNFNEIRSRFVKYHKELDFQLLPRASMLHPSIPMSYVMSAGLVQVETALAKDKDHQGNKFVLVQDCFRHFDLKSVGTDDIHLSLFEMPGAFIFGDDRRETAINTLWKLVTEVLGINAEQIWVTYFAGDELANHRLPKDEETYKAWQSVGVPQNQIIGLRKEHNYWVQGNSVRNQELVLRKSGPNTELFFDRGSIKKCNNNCQPGCRCGRFVEFSNTLFITHELCTKTNKLVMLAVPFVETVIGSERVAMILQNVESVFEIQSYRSVINAMHCFIDQTILPKKLIQESQRVIADHLRALCLLVADGAPPPGKGGRAHIIKLLVRGVITRQFLLGITSKDFLPTIIDTIFTTFGDTVQLTLNTENKIKLYFNIELLRFNKAIKRGQDKIERLLKENKGQLLSDSQIFILEKEWGIPNRLTEKILQEKGFTFVKTWS